MSRYLRRRSGKEQDWQWLLASRLVVILSEAGAGKSAELADQTARLNRDGYAFFLPIERLCSAPFNEAFDGPQARRRYEAWLRSSKPAVFFLDSVDEAKLPRDLDKNPLNLAIRRLELAVDSAWSRVTLVVSSRPSAWSESLELTEINRLVARFEAIGVKAGVKGAALARFVAFDPLDHRQQSALADWKGAPASFMEDLTHTGSSDFARTPLDLLDLVEAYMGEVEAGRSGAGIFSSLSAMVDRAITRRAAESGSDKPRNGLSVERTRQGARRLAAACVLGQQLAIRFGPGALAGIDPAAVLSFQSDDWPRKDIEQLLACGLFTAAWNGAVRFHHRRTMERLAAEAFDELLRAGMDQQTLWAQLTPSAFKTVTTPRPYQETVGWLTTLNPGFRAHILAVAPQMLLDLGDPGSLPSAVREAALRGYVARYSRSDWFDEHYEPALIRRFIDCSLEPVCCDLLDQTKADQALLFLIDLAVLAHWPSCVPRILRIALDDHASPDLRAGAVKAIARLGSAQDLRSVAESAVAYRASNPKDESHVRRARNRLRSTWVTRCRPHEMSIREALSVLCRLEFEGKSYSINRNPGLIDALVDTCPVDELEQALRWLSRLCWSQGPRALGSWDAPSWTAVGAHLLPGLERLAVRCLHERPDLRTSPLLIRTVDNLFAVRDVGLGPLSRDEDDGPDLLPLAVTVIPEFRQAVFMAAAAALPGKFGSNPGDVIDRYRPDPDGPDPLERIQADLTWMEQAYGETQTAPVRKALTDALVDRLRPLPRRTRRPLVQRLRVQALAVGDVAGAKQLVAPRPSPILRARWKIRQFWMRQRWLRLKHVRQTWIRTQKRKVKLALNHAALERGERFGLAYGVAFENRRSTPAIDHVRTTYGDRATAAIVAGAKIFARRHIVKSKQRTAGDGLAAFGWSMIALEEPDAFLAMTEAAAEQALNVALSESSFPDWGAQLADRHPGLWRRLILPSVQEELAMRDSGDWRHAWSLALAARQSEPVKRALAPDVLKALEASPSPVPDDIRVASHLIAADPALTDQADRLSARRFREHMAEGHPRLAAAWLSRWLSSDAAAAWREVRLIRDLYTPRGDVLIDQLLLAFGSHLPIGKANPDVLAQIALDLVRHIRPAEDVERGGEVTGRHNAQELRDSLPPLLAHDTTPAGRAALLALAQTPPFVEHRHWMERLLRSQANEAAMPKAWTAPEVISFFAAYLKPPGNAGELCDLIERHLIAIAKDLATSEFDRRGLFVSAREADVRAFIGEELLARSQGWYSVTQETVTADEKRYDLRIEGRPGRDEVVIVELKVAGKSWTGDELVDHVECQLADQYLISRKVRFGIYAVVDLQRKANWSMASGEPRTLDQLLDDMRAVARKVLSGTTLIEDLRVVAFNVGVPPKTKRVPERRSGSGKTQP